MGCDISVVADGQYVHQLKFVVAGARSSCGKEIPNGGRTDDRLRARRH